MKNVQRRKLSHGGLTAPEKQNEGTAAVGSGDLLGSPVPVCNMFSKQCKFVSDRVPVSHYFPRISWFNRSRASDQYIHKIVRTFFGHLGSDGYLDNSRWSRAIENKINNRKNILLVHILLCLLLWLGTVRLTWIFLMIHIRGFVRDFVVMMRWLPNDQS